jgi:hypothetical protein
MMLTAVSSGKYYLQLVGKQHLQRPFGFQEQFSNTIHWFLESHNGNRTGNTKPGVETNCNLLFLNLPETRWTFCKIKVLIALASVASLGPLCSICPAPELWLGVYFPAQLLG